MKFSKTQVEEIQDRIKFRLQTLKDDPESADEFESEAALKIIKQKLKTPDPSFTAPERDWIIEELSFSIQIAEDVMDECNKKEKAYRKKFIEDMQDAINLL